MNPARMQAYQCSDTDYCSDDEANLNTREQPTPSRYIPPQPVTPHLPSDHPNFAEIRSTARPVPPVRQLNQGSNLVTNETQLYRLLIKPVKDALSQKYPEGREEQRAAHLAAALCSAFRQGGHARACGKVMNEPLAPSEAVRSSTLPLLQQNLTEERLTQNVTTKIVSALRRDSREVREDIARQALEHLMSTIPQNPVYSLTSDTGQSIVDDLVILYAVSNDKHKAQTFFGNTLFNQQNRFANLVHNNSSSGIKEAVYQACYRVFQSGNSQLLNEKVIRLLDNYFSSCL